MAARHLERGREGERVAKSFLKKKGYKIVAENWRGAGGELDMVAAIGNTLVFVEVKARDERGMAGPAEAVTREKRRRLTRAAGEYLSKHKLWKSHCRFDVVLVTMSGEGDAEPEIEHIENAFGFSDAMGRGNPSWQPW
jgi:putative endonuclease